MTDYNDRFTATFYDLDGNRIDVAIKTKDYSGTAEELTLDVDPIKIITPVRDYLDSVFGTGCSITVINTFDDPRAYDELFGTGERLNYVSVVCTIDYGGTPRVTTLFEGFIVPDVYSQEFKQKARITITASNQLQELRQRYLTGLDAEGTGFVKLIDVLKECLWGTGLELPIYIKNTLYSRTIQTEYETTWVPFEHTYVDEQLFITRGEAMNMYEILNLILKRSPFNSRVYYCNGRWMVDRRRDIAAHDSYRVFHPNGTTQIITVPHPSVALENEDILHPSFTRSYERGVSELWLVLDASRYDNYVNPSFTDIVTEPRTSSPLGMESFRYSWKTVEGLNIIDASYVGSLIASGIYHKKPGSTFTGNLTYPTCPVLTSFMVRLDVGNVISIQFSHDCSIYAGIKSLAAVEFTTEEWEVRSGFYISYRETEFGNSRFIGRDEDGKFIVTSAYLFEDWTTVANIPESLLVSSERIVFSEELLQTIREDIGEELSSLQMYIYFVPLTGRFTDNAVTENPTLGWYHNDLKEALYNVGTVLGDVNIVESSQIMPNVLIGSIDNSFVNRLEVEIAMYDSYNFNYKNVLYNKPFPQFEIYTPLDRWCDKYAASELLIQYLYMQDLIQQYNSPRNKLRMDVKIRSEIFTAGMMPVPSLGSVFTHAGLDGPESSADLLRFIPVGMTYNVLYRMLRLDLHEFQDADDYEIDYGALECNPTSIDKTYAAQSFTVEVVTDGWWSVEKIYSSGVALPGWFNVDRMNGRGNATITVYLNALTGDDSATLRFKRGVLTADCVINRVEALETLNITPLSVEVDEGGDSFNLEIYSTTDWTIEVDYITGDEDWIEIDSSAVDSGGSGTGDEIVEIVTGVLTENSTAEITVRTLNLEKTCLVGALFNTPPNPPGWIAMLPDGSRLNVSWASVSGATGYVLERSENSGAYINAYTGANSSLNNDGPFLEGNSVQYRVKATAGGLASDWKYSHSYIIGSMESDEPEQ